jgi:hypothetical protein
MQSDKLQYCRSQVLQRLGAAHVIQFCLHPSLSGRSTEVDIFSLAPWTLDRFAEAITVSKCCQGTRTFLFGRRRVEGALLDEPAICYLVGDWRMTKMTLHFLIRSLATAAVTVFLVTAAQAGTITLFSTGSPDGKIATLSRPAGAAGLETETADDFILGQPAVVSSATFIGLLPTGALVTSIADVEIELYHVFPVDSTTPPDGRVVTRNNSPSDNQFAAFDSGLGSLGFTTTILNSSFTALNSVVNGIHAMPNQFTGGEGSVTGEEVQFNVTFTTPFFVGGTDHDFFRPEVALTTGNFLWLSAPKPITSPGTAFQFPGGPATDLQSWIRNDGTGGLSPDWERIGTDVTGQGPFNAAFSLTGTVVPEPSSAVLLAAGLAALIWRTRRS